MDEIESDSSQSTSPDTETQPPISVNPTEPEFDFDIELPDNANHEAVIEVFYKRYALAFGVIAAGITGIALATDVIVLNFARSLFAVELLIFIPLLVLLWIFGSIANN